MSTVTPLFRPQAQNVYSLRSRRVFHGAQSVPMADSVVSAPKDRPPLNASHPSPNAALLRAYLQFGAMTTNTTFDLNKFMKSEINEELSRVLQDALRQRSGPTANILDLVSTLVDYLEKDMTFYQQHAQSGDEETRYQPAFFLAKRMGMATTDDFLNTKKTRLQRIRSLKTEVDRLRDTRKAASPPNGGPPLFEPDIMEAFQAAKEANDFALNTNYKDFFTDLVTENVLLQSLLDISKDPNVKYLKDLLNIAQVGFNIPIREFYPAWIKSKVNVGGFQARPVDVTAQVAAKNNPILKGLEDDSSQIAVTLQQPDMPGVIAVLPNNLDKEKIVESVASQLSKGNKDDGDPYDVVQVNFLAILQGAKDENEAFSKLHDYILEQQGEHHRMVVHLHHFEWALDKYGAALGSLFQQMDDSGRVKWLFTLDEDFMVRNDGKLTRGGQSDVMQRFRKVIVSPLKKAEIQSYLSERKQEIERDNPEMTLEPAMLTDLVKYGQSVGLAYPTDYDRVLQDLLFLAKQETPPLKKLTVAKLRQLVQSGQGPRGLGKKASSIQLITPEEAGEKLPVTLVGVHNVLDAFKRLQQGIQEPDLFKFGSHPPRFMLLMGQRGSGKTALINHFAHQAKVPMVYLDATDLTGLPIESMNNAVGLLLEQAKSVYRRQASVEEDPHILIAVDNLEQGVAVGNGGEPIQGALSIFLSRMVEQIKRENLSNFLVVGTVGAKEGMIPDFTNGKTFDISASVEPIQFPDQRLELLKAIIAQKQAELGKRQLVGPDFDYVRAANFLFGVSSPTAMKIVLDKAASIASFKGQQFVTPENFDQALLELQDSGENRELYEQTKPFQRRWVAGHEGAHALAHVLTNRWAEGPHEENGDLIKVTAVPQGQGLGVTYFSPELQLIGKKTARQLFNFMVVGMISQVFERMKYGMNGTGISGDQGIVTQTALDMSARYLMLKNNIQLMGDGKGLKQSELSQAILDDMNRVIEASREVSKIMLRDDNYAGFIEEFTTALVGEDGRHGKETVWGQDFIDMLEAWEKKHPQVFERTKGECLAVIQKLFDNARDTKAFPTVGLDSEGGKA